MTALAMPAVRATMLGPDAAGLRRAGELLRAGKLVAFPTETVYGLGANALNEEAVLDIFRVKGRPLTDPLIVHVPTPDMALQLFEADKATATIVDVLATAFWPGPLTLVAKAAASLPLCVSAGTGFVGVRCPAHAVAVAMLTEAAVPVAAPSANRFGHVSPTTAQHVLDDLGTHDIAVLDAPGCDVGIESTVAKIDAHNSELLLLRRGGVSESALRAALDKAGLGHFAVRAKSREEPAVVADGVAAVAPGQLLTHYAPDKPTFLAVVPPAGTPPTASESAATAAPVDSGELASSCVVDFGGRLAHLAGDCAAYRDLSPAGSVSEAARVLFDTLRWTESVEAAQRVLLVDLMALRVSDEHVGALYDRMFRAASGRRVPMGEAQWTKR
ncbi:DHBP synthase RibB-like alpha/beta domain-containing protein [Pavlovales sp. CCMP2436]|nr:DHBP synthase RibB-like alpha/beta domain-containing protein [Pavlovales sp. CCMP2436]